MGFKLLSVSYNQEFDLVNFWNKLAILALPVQFLYQVLDLHQKIHNFIAIYKSIDFPVTIKIHLTHTSSLDYIRVDNYWSKMIEVLEFLFDDEYLHFGLH
jgi:hypothetical protein